jgi:8-oxo-dGTP pyrophosphatase MutT (NUDIX family)
MHRNELLGMLARHRTRFMEESAYIDRATGFVEQHPDCFHCDYWPAHVTGSAWVLNPDRSRVLLMHHRKHEQWFQPGGHADGEADIMAVALRETAEESGIDPGHIRLVDGRIFDLDIHRIPASHRGPEHEHIDVRFLVEIDDRLPLPGNDESHEVRWVPLAQVSRFNNNRSTFRMLEKTRQLRRRAFFG